MKKEKDPIEEMFDESNFKSIEIHLSVKNSTTNMKVPAESHPAFTELLDKGCIIEIPKKSCAKNHMLIVDFHITLPNSKPKKKISVTAKVDQVEPTEGDTDQVTVTLIQFVQEDWDEFKAIYDRRQEEITSFLAMAKGY